MNVVFRIKRYLVHPRQDQSLSRMEALEVSKTTLAVLPQQRWLEPESLYPQALCFVPPCHSLYPLPPWVHMPFLFLTILTNLQGAASSEIPPHGPADQHRHLTPPRPTLHRKSVQLPPGKQRAEMILLAVLHSPGQMQEL